MPVSFDDINEKLDEIKSILYYQIKIDKRKEKIDFILFNKPIVKKNEMKKKKGFLSEFKDMLLNYKSYSRNKKIKKIIEVE